MAISQYIGARYVPKFYENANNTSDWTANTQYEPLTIVTRNGNSYTSKKAVPASVGEPENNADYWASTGIYNQQVEQYRQEVQSLAQDVQDVEQEVQDVRQDTADAISALNNIDFIAGHILFISDSYITAVSPSWADIVGQRLGKVANTSYFISARGGTGFNAYVDGVNFTTLLNNAVVSDPDKISAVIVQGGSNDIYSANISGIENGITAFCNAAKTRFPNARIFIGMCDAWIDTAFNFGVRDTLYRNYQNGAASNGAFFLGATGSQLKLQKDTLLQSDLKHPTAAGMTALANETIANMLGQQLTTEMINNTQYYYKRSGDEVKITFYGNLNYTPDTVIDSLTCNGVSPVDIPCANGNVIISDDLERGEVMLSVVSGSNYYDVPAGMCFTHTGIRVYPFRMSDDHSNFLTISSVRQIVIRGGNTIYRPAHVIG